MLLLRSNVITLDNNREMMVETTENDTGEATWRQHNYRGEPWKHLALNG